MATVRAFRAIRPAEGAAARVAALPYDVMSAAEAREMTRGDELSFLHVDKAEIDLDPAMDPYSDAVYAKAKSNLDRLIREGALFRDADEVFYIYKLTMDGREQAGFVGCASADDYLENRIRKHEFTRADKERDRIRHVDTLNANTGPIFLAHRAEGALSRIAAAWMASHDPIYDFTADGGVRHTVYRIGDPAENERITAAFADVPALYIADGHHRCASAVRVAQLRRAANPGYTGDEEFNFFLAVIFPADQLAIMDYNRLLKDMNGLDEKSLFAEIEKSFDVSKAASPVHPAARHEFGMCLAGEWYRLKAHSGLIDETDPVQRLDVSILQRLLLAPVFGIEDPRTSDRIDFAGGIRGLEYLEARVRDDMKAAFSLYPTAMDELMDIADAGEVMPPKSTWFEPKLLSGLFIHEL
ncbi:MAG: DUF1015 family protein [Clostridiales Family XIII bacterium]|jgi:uncharacterized protein (DUF1015 family)|nr:DUF1015 family protein [Clostridiales Family XIII bacterium]